MFKLFLDALAREGAVLLKEAPAQPPQGDRRDDGDRQEQREQIARWAKPPKEHHRLTLMKMSPIIGPIVTYESGLRHGCVTTRRPG